MGSTPGFSLDAIVGWAKRRGFVYPGSSIYGGLANARDLGPYGVQLRKNIYDTRRRFFVQNQPDIVGIDGALLMHPKVWEASGHVHGFNDPLIDDKNTGERFRADKLLEDSIDTYIKKSGKDEADAIKELENMRKNTYGVTNLVPGSWTLDQQYDVIIGEKIQNPNKKQDADWTKVRKFSLMLATHLGVIEDAGDKVWLRPETAQAMFVNFRNILDTTRNKLPFGLAQIGKAFRNEITPGNFLFRTREFEQMEIQMFCHPDDAAERFQKFQDLSRTYRLDLIGIKKDNLRNRNHADDELAHYARAARDFEYKYPRGWGELQGVHDRTDFDVKQHQLHSNKDLQYSDPYTGKRYVPYVVELSMGLSRTLMTVMCDAYDEETYTDQNGDEQTRVVLRFNKRIAPVQFAIFPLVKKDDAQTRIAKEIYNKLSLDYFCEYDDAGAIGKRYRRQDEIGTPYCITVDHQSSEDNTVTIRDRDTMLQKRVHIDQISF